MENLKEFIPVIGPVLAALIAGSVAFLASVLTKENKTSEFRQAWIDGLRDDISEFVANFYWISDMTSHKPGEFLEFKDEHVKAERVQARIELRLNDKKEHREILRQLHGLARFESFDFRDAEARNQAVYAFVAESRKVLKKEWKRVKRGELIFQLTKWLSLSVVVALAALSWHLIRGNLAISYVA